MSIQLLRTWSYSIFISRYVGLNFEEEFTLKIENEYIKLIHLEAVPKNEKDEVCELKVTFHLKDLDKNVSLSDVRLGTEELLNLISDYLSFEYGLSIKKIEGPGVKLSAQLGRIKHFLEEDKIKMEKEFNNMKFEPYKRLYRSAMSNDDDIARFMFLYSILFDVLEANGQSAVDRFIRSECPEVYKHGEDTPSEKKDKNGHPVRDETIYTWLRNQVGHTQSKSKINSITGTIEIKIKELEFIVAKAINMYAS